ncbi:MAG: hypothetical protein JNG86_16390 [Verrucomicrobiaceae bacterium]|nr:hypothetical protein [Verrucomicrobiaceae bacterium]
MKTKLHILLAVLSFSTVTLHAGLSSDTLNLCGGADDDQFLPLIFELRDICGGADDDQFLPPVMRGIVTDPTSLHGNDGSDTLSEFDQLWNTVMAAPAPQMPPPGAPRPPSSQSPTSNRHSLVPPPGGIVGGDGADFLRPRIVGGNDMVTGDAGDDVAGAGAFASFVIENSICGSNENDSILIDDPWLLTLIYGETGSDSLWGGGGTDEAWDTPMEVPLR